MKSAITILTIIGARPQFIKAAMVSRAIIEYNKASLSPKIIEQIIHTGQHYDENMSQIFFEQMEIPKPAVNLHIGGGQHGEMTGKMLVALEQEIITRDPDWVLVYGDTNSTLAGALAASKLHVPVAHVEAGLRSFNREMPEEVNRVLTDHVSTVLFCPTTAAIANLNREGITKGVQHVGDVMYDAAKLFGDIAMSQSTILVDTGLVGKPYYLATVHRAENTDDPARLREILAALGDLAAETPVVLPLHPRTKQAVNREGLADSLAPLTVLPPVSFLDMVMLEKNAQLILTDSGGVQKEAYFHGVPCVTLRDETEWVETVQAGWNILAGANRDKIIAATRHTQPKETIAEYGRNNAAKIVSYLIESS